MRISMRILPISMAAALAMTALTAAPALADRRCPPASDVQWMPIEKAITTAEALGYVVLEVERSRGCWEIDGFDRNGAEIELYLHGQTGEVLKPRNWRPPAAR